MTGLFLIAHVAGRTVAIGSDQVESVVDIGEITAVPRAPAMVRGLAALRSRVVTVLDTWRLLGLEPPADGGRRAVVTAVDGHLYAVLVDSLEDAEPFAPVPLAAGLSLGPRWSAIAARTADRDGEPMLVVDLARLVRTAGEP